MRTPVFTGACPALVTPFNQSGAIDYDAFGKQIDNQIAAGVDAVCVCGTTGESATMSIREHIAAVEFCVKRVDHLVKVIAGAGSNDTSAAVYLSQHAQDSGADALLHVTPYYNKASQTGLVKHYEYIADRVDLPIILYNVPSRTGVSLGAKGVISVASNIIPEVMVKMSHSCLDNDFESAAKLQIQYMELIDALFLEVNPIPIKAAMNLLGMDAGMLRLPLCDISDKNLETLRQAMQRAGLL